MRSVALLLVLTACGTGASPSPGDANAGNRYHTCAGIGITVHLESGEDPSSVADAIESAVPAMTCDRYEVRFTCGSAAKLRACGAPAFDTYADAEAQIEAVKAAVEQERGTPPGPNSVFIDTCLCRAY